jgi:hypothetical protein
MFDREALKSQAFYTDNDYSVKYPNVNPQVSQYGSGNRANPDHEGQEELWLDDNAVPVLVNRYNGTLLRGE